MVISINVRSNICVTREKQKEAYEALLTEYDTEDKTLGCRHTNPGICKYADVRNVCAFV